MRLIICGVLVVLALPRGVFAKAYLAWTTDYPSAYDTQGFQALSRLEYFRVFDGAGKSHGFQAGGDALRLHWIADPPAVELFRGQTRLVRVALAHLLDNAARHRKTQPTGPIPQRLLTAEGVGQGKRLRIYVEDLAAEVLSGGKLRVLHFKADVLVGQAVQKP